MYNKLLFRFRSLQVSTVEDPIINKSLSSGITHHQSGAVLIISLVILLLLTLIGASSIQTTTLEEKMAGNLRDRDFAFQAAESGLIDAESALNVMKASLDPVKFSEKFTNLGTDGFYSESSPIPIPSAILKDDFWKTYPTITSSIKDLGNSINPPRYIIQKLTNITGITPGVGCFITPCSVNRITVRATGALTSTVVILQSTIMSADPSWSEVSWWTGLSSGGIGVKFLPTIALTKEQKIFFEILKRFFLNTAIDSLDAPNALPTFTDAGSMGFYSETSSILTPSAILTLDFWNNNPTNTFGVDPSIAYIIQEISACITPPCSMPSPSSYKITVKATDPSTKTDFILQATYSPTSTSTSGVRKSWQQLK